MILKQIAIGYISCVVLFRKFIIIMINHILTNISKHMQYTFMPYCAFLMTNVRLSFISKTCKHMCIPFQRLLPFSQLLAKQDLATLPCKRFVNKRL